VRFPLTPRASSRSATRRFSSSRLSCCFFAFGEGDRHLRDAVLEVQLERHDG